MNGELDDHGRETAQLPYSNCHTKTIDLRLLDLPDSATEHQYRDIYLQYVQTGGPNALALREAVESIRYGIAPPVAFPTETVYGLGADATNEPAVAGIFAAKGRPGDNPLIVHAASASHIERLTGEPISEIYRSIVKKFWPGALTILLPVPERSTFAKNVHPGQPTIGFRVPLSKYARFFIAATDRPIAGPSANSSGKPSPTTARHVLDDLSGKINFILDGGPCDVGVESTVVDGLHDPPLILRPGGVSQQELIAHGRQFGNAWSRTAIGYATHGTTTVTPTMRYDMDLNGAPRAPGMKYRHYAPTARLILFSGPKTSTDHVREKLNSLLSKERRPLTVGVISCRWPNFAGLPVSVSSSTTVVEANHGTLGATAAKNHSLAQSVTKGSYIHERGEEVVMLDVKVGYNPVHLAHALFGLLRLFDDLKCDFIFAETVSRDAVNKDQDLTVVDAVADRMDKAAAERVGDD